MQTKATLFWSLSKRVAKPVYTPERQKRVLRIAYQQVLIRGVTTIVSVNTFVHTVVVSLLIFAASRTYSSTPTQKDFSIDFSMLLLLHWAL